MNLIINRYAESHPINNTSDFNGYLNFSKDIRRFGILNAF